MASFSARTIYHDIQTRVRVVLREARLHASGQSVGHSQSLAVVFQLTLTGQRTAVVVPRAQVNSFSRGLTCPTAPPGDVS